jgi:hypothetical protein
MGGKKSKPAKEPVPANRNNSKEPTKALEYKLLIVGDAGECTKYLRFYYY